ncbi:MAG TPA: transglycosylase domain-containing protein, partial [Hyphomicrobiaceae bacterium]|nr:transglycosylase domain-containing protein [Hyphomicrobiaceae bacterium]
MRGGWPRRLKRLLIAMLIGIAISAAAFEVGLRIAFAHLGELPLAATEETSVAVLDREDRLLRAFTTADGRWRLPVEVGDVDPRYLAMLIAFEDKRFWSHPGVDPMAMTRAAGQLVRHGRIVSGGSTITMQVARLIDGPKSRSATTKFWQMVRALQLERRYSKADILRLYLRLAPFGGNIEGTRAASLAYFGKEPRHLSIGEAALLVALPQSPRLRRPDRHATLARSARDRVLVRARHAGVVSAEDHERSKGEPVPDLRLEFPKLAAHLAEAERAHAPRTSVHRLTLDARLQRDLERLARDHVRPMGPRLSAAILALDHTTGEVLAHVGSAGYLDDDRFGAIDMTRAVRSP